MVALRSRFDGQHIEVPQELRGFAPADVLIVFPAEENRQVPLGSTRPSIWDAVGKAEQLRSAMRSTRKSEPTAIRGAIGD